jgi:hypothetical protein
MRKHGGIAPAAVACIAATGACGGTTEGSSGSGLPARKPLSELTAAEVQEVCTWAVNELGGDGKRYVCGDTTITIDASRSECEEILVGCEALIMDVEDCIREQKAILDTCRLKDAQPACDRLDALCDDDDDDVGAPRASSGPDDCIPGQAVQCTCDDGSSGAQMCAEDGSAFEPCACAPLEPPGCTPGSTQSCSCTDGRAGAQECREDGVLGPCYCAPAVGACTPAFCPAASGGSPCCVGPDGPCGVDFGAGCTSVAFGSD